VQSQSNPAKRRRHRRTAVAAIAGASAMSLLLGACSSSSSAPSGDAASGGGTASEITAFLIPSPTEEAIKKSLPDCEAKTGVKVTIVDAPYSDAHQKMLLSFQAKQGAYDIVQYDNPYLAPFASQNALAELDSYLGKSTAYDIGDFVQPLQDYSKYDGVTYGLNLSTEPFLLWYRTDIYDQLGLKVPTTWDEYLANAQTIQESGLADGQVIANASSVNSWWWLQLLWSFGGDLQDASGNVTLDTPEAQKATEFMKSLLAVSPQSATTATGDDATTLFTTQDVGQMINYSGYYPVITDPAQSKFVDKIATASIPKGDTDITQLTGWNIGIPADSKAKDSAWAVLECLLGKDNAVKFIENGAAAIGRTSVVTDPDLTAKYPYIALLGPASETGRRLPALVQWAEVSNQIGVHVQDMLTGKTSVQDGLSSMQSEVSATLGN
jgi:multiple sugar transport system substrate-binding protein